MSNLTSDELAARLYASRKEVYNKARGVWPELLLRTGVDPDALRMKKGQSCPLCGLGKDCYTFTDRLGDGDYICRKCGAGKGVTFLMKYHNWSWTEAVDETLALLADPDNASLLSKREERKAAFQAYLTADEEERRRMAFRRVWSEACPVQLRDPVHQYLMNRAPFDEPVPGVLRYHPALPYYIRNEKVVNGRPIKLGEFPAMVAAVFDGAGRVCNMHRTYITHDGHKAKIVDSDGVIHTDVKKLMRDVGATGFHVPLFRGEHRELGVAEGIETAWSARQLTKIPTQSVVNTAGMKGFVVPPWVEYLTIFADNDQPDVQGRRAGIIAAKALAERPDVVERIKSRSLRVSIRMTGRAGTDFADLYKRLATKA